MEHPQTQKSLIEILKDDGSLYVAGYILICLFIPYFLPQGLIAFLKPYALLVAKIIPNIVVFANYSPDPDLVLCVFATHWMLCPLYIILFLKRNWYLEKRKIGFFKRLCLIIILFAFLYAIIFLPKQWQLGNSPLTKIRAFEELMHNYLWANFFFAFAEVCTATFLIFALIFLLTGSRPLSDVFGRK